MVRRGLAVVLLLVATAPMALAQTLQPFRATYSATLDTGVAITADATRELKQLEDGSWVFSSQAQALVASQSEETRFTYSSHGIQPQEYRYRRKVLGRKRAADLSFDWTHNRVTTRIKNKPWQMDVPSATQDKLSYQLQLRLDLAAGKRELLYPVADGGPLSEYRFRVLGEETVTTPEGDYVALKVERVRETDSPRTTHIWFAPALDYLIVKLHQTESDGKEYGLLLNHVETQ
jgi:hypothetical protein